MAEEEFHEIQLNGKQLVFLFMTGTVAAVVIFLCGLMVGRNLRTPAIETAAVTTDTAIGDPTRPEGDVPPPVMTTESSRPATIDEILTYDRNLSEPTPVDEPLQAAPNKPAARAETVTASRPSSRETNAVAATNPEPDASAWTVQVQAVNSRQEADAIARRLSSKGYPAFVTPRGSGNLFGIRVGKYPTRQAAEAMKTRLEREEQFKPWVTH